MPRNIPITITREKMDAAPSRWPGAVSLSQGEKAALEAAEGSVRLLVAFVWLVYITSDKMISRGFWRLCGAF